MIRPLICAVVFLLLSSSAKADTFTLTAGSANTGFAQFSLSVSGPNIRIGGGAGLCTVPGCDSVFGGAATINGVDFFGLNFGGELNFTGSIVLPNDYVNGQPVTVPFSMEGQLTGFIRCPGSLSPCSQQIFDISLNGSGIATATLPASGNGLVIYRFAPASEPVPEPATLGLLGVGLFALKRFYRSRRPIIRRDEVAVLNRALKVGRQAFSLDSYRPHRLCLKSQKSPLDRVSTETR